MMNSLVSDRVEAPSGELDGCVACLELGGKRAPSPCRAGTVFFTAIGGELADEGEAVGARTPVGLNHDWDRLAVVTVPLDCLLLCTCCSATCVGTLLEVALARGGCARHSDITPVCKPIVGEDNVQSSALTGQDLFQMRRTIGAPLAEPLTQPSCQSVVPLDDKTSIGQVVA